MPIADDMPLALANRFTVKVDAPGEIDLGSWAKVDGLDVTFDVVEYRAGDAWNSRWYCPGATKYSTVKLSRAVTADTEKVRKWLSDTAKSHKPGLMVIELKDSRRQAGLHVGDAQRDAVEVVGQRLRCRHQQDRHRATRSRAPRLPRRRHRLIGR